MPWKHSQQAARWVMGPAVGAAAREQRVGPASSQTRLQQAAPWVMGPAVGAAAREQRMRPGRGAAMRGQRMGQT